MIADPQPTLPDPRTDDDELDATNDGQSTTTPRQPRYLPFAISTQWPIGNIGIVRISSMTTSAFKCSRDIWVRI